MADEVATKDRAKKAKKARPKSGKAKEDEIPLADMKPSSSKFDQLLQQAVGQATDGAKKKKKKKAEAEAVLESLRKGEGLQKEEDAAIKANTYDPDNSPKNEKSNKRRQKLQEQAKDNSAFVNDDDKINNKKKKKKKPTEKSDIDTLIEDETSLAIDELATTPKKKKKPPDDKTATDTPTKAPRKKKKEIMSDEERPLSPTESESLETGKKKKKKPVSKSEEEQPLSEPTSPTSSVIEKKKKKKKVVEESEGERPMSPAESVTTPRKGKKKKKKGEETEDEDTRPLSPSEESMPATPTKTKGKKKKQQKEEERAMSPSEESVIEETTEKKKKKKKEKKPEEEKDEETEDKTTAKTKKKKKKKGEEEEAEEGEDQEEEEGEISPDEETEVKKAAKKKEKKKKKEPVDEAELQRLREETLKVEDEGEILSVTVHRTDKLKNDFHILHPLVRVHIVDETTGTYLQKQHMDRAVTAYFETENEHVDKVLPIMTQPFDFKERKSVLPVWEELLIFNENFNYFTQKDLNVIVFFEVLDFVSMNTARRQFTNQKTEGGWYRIAWAFLKIRGNNDKLNTGSKVRLQLFVPPSSSSGKSNQLEVYQWWRSMKREPYPSTLYVTIKGIRPPRDVEPALMRSMFATQEEVGSRTYTDLKKSTQWGEKKKGEHKTLSSWARLPGQTCRIPNTLHATLPAGRKGCFVLRFSHDGRSLACACNDRDQYPIYIYEVPSFELRGKLKGHFGLVYDLSWSKRDTQLLSASSDGTARVWNMDNFDNSEKLLPHPGFVYTAKFHPRLDSVIATGGYDQVIRVWDVSGSEPHGVLKQEIEDHRGHVNTLIFEEDGGKMYSGDSAGNVLIFNVFVGEQEPKLGWERDWTIYQRIFDPELKDVPINCLTLHHNGRRLLVHSRDNIIRMFDLRVQRVMQKYIGALNFREEIHSTMTPCGSFVFSGSEDNFAYTWNTETGDQVAMFSELNFQYPVTDIEYHPRDHMMALCSLGDNQPILIYNYDPHVAQIDAGLSPRHISVPEYKEPEEVPSTAMYPGSPRKEDSMKTTSGLGSRVLSKDEFQAHATARFEKVMRKLNSATAQMASSPSMDLPGVPVSTPRMGHTGLMMEPTMPRTMMASPQAFSPHASRTLTGIMQQQQFTNQNLYLKSGDSDWRPGFSEVGRHGARSSSPTFIGRPPTISLTHQDGGKAQFSFQAPAGKSVSRKQVIAMYDYRAQRSDELSLFKGDVITVLYKDNDNWWMGELPDGQQGFFPSSYVAEEDSDNMADNRPVDDSDEDDDVAAVKKKYTAYRTKTGELKFLSGAEESDDDVLEAKPKKKKNEDLGEGSETGSVGSKVGSTGSKAGSTGSKGTKKKQVSINESTA
uniref:Jouberin-like isoform X2 n=1 Tax=Crassostrea virginica TaxID=6565 RepID=A0A8B8DYG5_CRAVI|nr:jouberin-like isoform X2 [Crassostrea virginica]